MSWRLILALNLEQSESESGDFAGEAKNLTVLELIRSPSLEAQPLLSPTE